MTSRAYIIRIIIMFFCFLSRFPSEAQELITGIKVGYSTSIFTGSAITNSNHCRMPGINIGGILNKPFQKFDLQAELLISSKGCQINSIGDTQISNLLIYIDLPLLLKKEIFTRNDFGVFLTLGASLMYKILSINLVSELEGIRRLDSGLLLGIGAQYSKVSFELRINQSIINFDRVESSKYNQVISAGLNFYFKNPLK